MIGMDFVSFLILFVIAVVIAAIAHYGMQYYVVSGFGSFLNPLSGSAQRTAPLTRSWWKKKHRHSRFMSSTAHFL